MFVPLTELHERCSFFAKNSKNSKKKKYRKKKSSFFRPLKETLIPESFCPAIINYANKGTVLPL